ncbi:MAG: M14 family zinc carboxypeptidase, partial [Anaerolineaceae bacterium]
MVHRRILLSNVLLILSLVLSLSSQPLAGPVAASNPPTGIPNYPCYRTLAEVYQSAASLAETYPTLASWVDIGDSWQKTDPGGEEGFDLVVLKLTNQATAGTKPVLFLLSGLHARELAAVELNLRFAEMLLSNYGSDPDVTWLLDKTELHLLLLANPDGRVIIESQIADGTAGEHGESARSKNTDPLTCANPSLTGVDLDRNFPFAWLSGPDGCQSGYPGSNSLSEPETQAIHDYLTSIFDDYRSGGPDDPALPEASGLFINLQNYGNKMYYPYFFRAEPAPESGQLQTLANKLTYNTRAAPATYHEGVGDYLSGTPVDYLYGELGVPALTFTLGKYYEGGYFTHCADFEASYLQTSLTALLRAAKSSLAPYQSPYGPEITNLALTVHDEGQTIWELNGSVSDALYKIIPAYQNIQSVSYSVDTTPWEPGAIPQPLLPLDGAFDEPEEEVWARLDSTGLTPSRHTVYVR